MAHVGENASRTGAEIRYQYAAGSDDARADRQKHHQAGHVKLHPQLP